MDHVPYIQLTQKGYRKVSKGYRKGIKKFYSGKFNAEESQYFDLNDLFNDIHFFLKLSNARREDYGSLEAITNVVAEYAKKHTETRWISMKYVALRYLDQWINLKEYFLNFLPKQKNFKHEMSKTQRHVRIKGALEESLTEVYVSFCAFVALDFESFLFPLQTKEPMIRLLYPSVCKLLSDLLSKCIKAKGFIKRILREHRFRQERKLKTLKLD